MTCLYSEGGATPAREATRARVTSPVSSRMLSAMSTTVSVDRPTRGMDPPVDVADKLTRLAEVVCCDEGLGTGWVDVASRSG